MQFKQESDKITFNFVCDSETNRNLARRRLNGDQAAHKEMVEGNLALIGEFARFYFLKARGNRGPFSYWDLYHEGVFGLLRAIEVYDPERNTSFSKFARKFIAGAIWNAFRSHRYLIRIPHGFFNSTDAIKRSRKKQVDLARNISVATLARNVSSITRSHNSQVYEKKYYPLDNNWFEKIHHCIDCLDPISKDVIWLRFFENLGRDKIAKKLSIRGKKGRCHVKIIEQKALAYMREQLLLNGLD